MIEKPLYRYGRLDSGGLCKLFRSPDVYIPSADDHTKPEDIQRFIDNALASPVMYVLGRNPKQEAFIFAPSHNATTYQAHMAVKRENRGPHVVSKVAEAGKWLFDHTTCRAILCFLREENEGARSIMGQIGMKQIGRTHKTVLFNGEYQDELIYQCTVEDYNALWGYTFGEVA